MADPVTTFRGYYNTTPDPYAAPADVYATYLIAHPLGPAGLLAASESAQYPTLLVMATEGTHMPQVALAPFSGVTLPGVAPPVDKYAFTGDVSAEGALPSLLLLDATPFHRSGAVDVRPEADITTAVAALPAGQRVLDVPAAGQAVEQVETRRAMPAPPPYAEAIMTAVAQGTLTFAWLWTNTAQPIIADPAQHLAYQPWVDFLRVSLSMRPPLAAGGPNRNPATERVIEAVLMTPPLQDRAMEVARMYLPGLRRPIGVGAQLAQVEAGQQNLQAQVLAAQNRPVTIESKNVNLFHQLQRVCEVAAEADFAPFWAQFPDLRSGQWLGTLENCLQRVAQLQEPPMTAPFVTPPFATDIATGRFTSRPNDIMEGLSIFRIIPGNSPVRDMAADRNRVYNALMVGTGAAQVSAVQFVLDNANVVLPEDGDVFRGQLEGYYCLLAVVTGQFNRATVAYYNEVVRDRTSLIERIKQNYPDVGQQRYIYLIIMTYIFRVTNDYLGRLLTGPAPLGVGVPAPAAPAVPPYGDIANAIALGQIMMLTAPPPQVLRPIQRPLAGFEYQGPYPPAPGGWQPQSPPVPAPAPSGGPPGAETPGGPSRTQVERRDQNPQLKRKWAELGHTSVFGVGSPFHDESLPNNKKVVMSDTPNKRICLPMALNGVCYSNCGGKHGPLNSAEEQRVAAAGGFEL